MMVEILVRSWGLYSSLEYSGLGCCAYHCIPAVLVCCCYALVLRIGVGASCLNFGLSVID